MRPWEGIVASSKVHTATAYKVDKKEELLGGHEVKLKLCRFCGRAGHGKNPSLPVREKKLSAWNKECNHCHSKRHYKSRCPRNGYKVGYVKVQKIVYSELIGSENLAT